ncbi:hypothetical protein CRUP_010143, partial [Coryphaenoides rupestris]
HRTATNGIESYDPRADRWVAVATDREEAPCGYHGIVVLHGSVYHVGGFDGVDFHNSMRRLDLATRRWHAAAPMHERRGYVCVAVVGGGFYATGGHNGHRRLSGVERYLPDGNQRTRVASMCHAARQGEARAEPSAKTTNKHPLPLLVYICGGFNGTEYLQSAECYDPRYDQWTLIPSMGIPRFGVSAVAYKDRLYVVRMGLLSPEYIVSHVQSNSLVQSVQGCGAMVTEALQVLHALATHGPAVHNLRSPLTRPRLPHTVLLACGGWSHRTATNKIESYDPRADRWVAVATDREEAPCALHGIVVLHGSVYHVGGYDAVDFCNTMRRYFIFQ